MSVSTKERKNVTIDLVKCACPDCVCVLNAKEGLERDGRIYFGSACADHYENGNGCKHAGCVCHG
jgi:metallothionein